MSNKVIEEIELETCKQCSSKFSEFIPVVCLDEILYFRDKDQIVFKGTILEFYDKYINK